MRRRFSALALSALVASTLPALAPAAAQPADGDLFISEFHYDNEGTDSGEFVEVTAPAGTDVSDLSLVLYNGNGGSEYDTTALTGTVPDQTDGYGTVVVDYPVNGIQNGSPDGIALVDGATVVEFLSYEGTVTAVGGPADGVTSTDVGVEQDAGTPVGASIERTGAVPAEYTWESTDTNSKGAVNADLDIDGDGGGGGDDPGEDPAPGPAPDGTVFISEFHYDNAGADEGEFVEVTAPAGTDLTGWSVALYNGSNDEVYDTATLDGVVPDQTQGYGTTAVDIVLQNGSPDGIALVDDTGELVEFLSYEGTMTAAGGPADGETSRDVAVEQPSNTPVGASIERVGEVPEEFEWVSTDTNSKGAPNPGSTIDGTVIPEPEPEPEPDPVDLCEEVGASDLTPIHDVQGDGDSSPIEGETVTVEGVVTGDFQDNDQPDDGDLDGFFVQEQVPDDDPMTSEGVFVYDPGGPDVSTGDVVRIRGEVEEFFEATQLGQVSDVSVCGAADLPAPTDVTFPLEDRSELERYEGMRVRFPQDLAISEYFNYDRFGEIVLSLPFDDRDRLYTPTAVVEPGEPANQLQDRIERRRITLDDGLTVQNPDVTRHPNGQPFSLDNRFRGGDTVTDTVGVLNYSFDLYRIQPTQPADYTATNPRTEAPEDVGGDVTVSSFNVLNYFLTIDDGSNDVCGGNQNLECRGADDQEELDRQRTKILAALEAIEADVFGIIEMENTPDVEPLADLVDGLNEVFGDGTYDFVDTGAIGTDAIRNGIIYRADTVTPEGDFAVLDSSVDDRFLDQKNRPVLAQSFVEDDSGEVFTVAVNHLKSKGSSCADVGDPGTGDGQGNCNGTRTEAAEAMVDWLAGDPTDSGDPDVLVTGDLNAYDHEDPIDAIVEGPDDELGTADDYTDLVLDFQGEFAYSFVFDGLFGYLDHALSNGSLTPQVTGTTVWHINADEPDILDYDTSFKSEGQQELFEPNAFRSSDHDPVIVGLDLTGDDTPPEEPAPDQPETKDDCKNGGWQDFDDPSFRNQGQCVAFVASDGKSQGGNGGGRGNGGGPPGRR
jgi:predicted extracellular nuclease